MFQALAAISPEQWTARLTVAFDWYDGPREGMCSLEEPRVEFYFWLLAERFRADDLDDRLFGACGLEEGTTADLVELLRFAGPPAFPVWAPLWASPTVAEVERANVAIDSIRARSVRSPSVVIRTSDFVRFSGVWRYPANQAVADWFAWIGTQ